MPFYFSSASFAPLKVPEKFLKSSRGKGQGPGSGPGWHRALETPSRPEGGGGMGRGSGEGPHCCFAILPPVISASAPLLSRRFCPVCSVSSFPAGSSAPCWCYLSLCSLAPPALPPCLQLCLSLPWLDCALLLL